jgi:DNA-binding SARP family transcriptional activator/tetratricopeptide (TPR) repeat protein
MDRLIEAIYGEDLPPTSRAQAQISISSLRRIFAAHGHQGIITTHDRGYVIQVKPEELDSLRFDELIAAARTARVENKLELAIARYRDALRLWRGPALDGMYSQLIQVAVSRLDEQRIAANEDRIELELEVGRHHEIVGELGELAAQYPLRERPRGQLMLALYRCGRVAEALQVYQLTRRSMIDELGIDPSERLRQLEQSILASDPSLDLPAAAPRAAVHQVKQQAPNLLAADIADFTGREDEINQIYRYLIPSGEREHRHVAPIVVIVGKGGIGKTSIALHASHGMTSHFPDGQLYADLHGGTSHPVQPIQVLERFLRALGVPGTQIPEGIDERAELYRNLLGERKVLVVLDDAAGESQVLPLLPGGGNAAVVITSRSRLAGLPGALRLEVDVFDADKSLNLLARIVGAERVQTQADAALAVAEQCGHLPLALRIAGARLVARPHWSIQRLVERLTDETRRLDELRHGDMGIRSSISLTYDSASNDARRLFRRLALLDMPVFSSWLCAALLDEALPEAEDLLDDLVSAQLIDPIHDGAGAYSQYRFHDLIRVFARERLAAEESAAERQAALDRSLGGLLFLAEAARIRYYSGDYLRIQNDAVRWPLPPQVTDQLVKDPLAWFDRERTTLVSGVRQAAQAGLAELCWGLASSAVTLFDSRTYLDDWQETHTVALAATRKARLIRGQAAMLYTTGTLHMTQQRFEQARQELDEAAQLFLDAADEHGMALVIRHIAFMDRLSGRLDSADRRYEEALAIFERTEDHIGSAYVLQSLAQVKLELGDADRAKELLSDALRMCRIAHCGRIEAQVLHRMGEALLLDGDPAHAIETFRLALTMIRDVGDPIGEAYILHGMGVAQLRQGTYGQAGQALQRALDLADGVGERLAEARALAGLCELALAAGDLREAVEAGEQAVEEFRGIDAPLYEAQVLLLLSDAYSALGDSDAACAASRAAAALRAKPRADRPALDAGSGGQPQLFSPGVIVRPEADPATWAPPAGETATETAAVPHMKTATTAEKKTRLSCRPAVSLLVVSCIS